MVGPTASGDEEVEIIAGGNGSIQGIDLEGTERLWVATGDKVTALALVDIDGDGQVACHFRILGLFVSCPARSSELHQQILVEASLLKVLRIRKGRGLFVTGFGDSRESNQSQSVYSVRVPVHDES